MTSAFREISSTGVRFRMVISPPPTSYHLMCSEVKRLSENKPPKFQEEYWFPVFFRSMVMFALPPGRIDAAGLARVSCLSVIL